MADQGLADSSPAPADNSPAPAPAPALADNSSAPAPAPAPAEEESEEEEGDQEGEDCVGSQEKQLKGAGKRKYAPVECAASVLAAVAASELGETDTVALLRRVQDHYPKKAQYFQTLNLWGPPHDTSGPRSTPIGVQESCNIRTPDSVWSKARDVRKEVMNRIAPEYNQVVREGHSGWGKTEFVAEAKKRWGHEDETVFPLTSSPLRLSFP